MRKKLVWLALAVMPLLSAAVNLNQETSSQTFSVEESTFTDLTCPLDKANFLQVIIPSSSGTPQVFTFRHTNGSTVEIPEGGSYEIGPLRGEVTGGSVIGAVQTATGATTIQVIAQRVQ